jgi:hypothetical protein
MCAGTLVRRRAAILGVVNADKLSEESRNLRFHDAWQCPHYRQYFPNGGTELSHMSYVTWVSTFNGNRC